MADLVTSAILKRNIFIEPPSCNSIKGAVIFIDANKKHYFSISINELVTSINQLAISILIDIYIVTQGTLNKSFQEIAQQHYSTEFSSFYYSAPKKVSGACFPILRSHEA